MVVEVPNKIDIKARLRQAFSDVIYTIYDLSDEQFGAPRATDKWSPAEIVGHLILSTKPINKAMGTPKLMLKAAFGKNNREEKPTDQLISTYKEILSGGLTAPKNFIYKGATEKGKDIMISKFTDELDKLLAHIDKWKEKDLTDYVLPHPAIGKLTIREMLLFTEFHTKHHHKQMLEVLEKSNN